MGKTIWQKSGLLLVTGAALTGAAGGATKVGEVDTEGNAVGFGALAMGGDQAVSEVTRARYAGTIRDDHRPAGVGSAGDTGTEREAVTDDVGHEEGAAHEVEGQAAGAVKGTARGHTSLAAGPWGDMGHLPGDE